MTILSGAVHFYPARKAQSVLLLGHLIPQALFPSCWAPRAFLVASPFSVPMLRSPYFARRALRARRKKGTITWAHLSRSASVVGA